MAAFFGVFFNLAFYLLIFWLIGKSFPKKEPEGKKKRRRRVAEAPLDKSPDSLLALHKKEELARGQETLESDSEIKEEIYYNDLESAPSFSASELRKAIIYSEIIGQPVSKRRSNFNRR